MSIVGRASPLINLLSPDTPVCSPQSIIGPDVPVSVTPQSCCNPLPPPEMNVFCALSFSFLSLIYIQVLTVPFSSILPRFDHFHPIPPPPGNLCIIPKSKETKNPKPQKPPPPPPPPPNQTPPQTFPKNPTQIEDAHRFVDIFCSPPLQQVRFMVSSGIGTRRLGRIKFFPSGFLERASRTQKAALRLHIDPFWRAEFFPQTGPVAPVWGGFFF